MTEFTQGFEHGGKTREAAIRNIVVPYCAIKSDFPAIEGESLSEYFIRLAESHGDLLLKLQECQQHTQSQS